MQEAIVNPLQTTASLVIKEGPQFYNGFSADPPIGSARARKNIFPFIIDKEKYYFFEHLDDFQFNALLKSENGQENIFQKVVYFWKCWDFEDILGGIWYGFIGKLMKPLGFLSKYKRSNGMSCSQNDVT